MPDGSYYVSIEDKKVYNRLPQGHYKLEVTTLDKEMVELSYQEVNIHIIDISKNGEFVSKTSITNSLTSVVL